MMIPFYINMRIRIGKEYIHKVTGGIKGKGCYSDIKYLSADGYLF